VITAVVITAVIALAAGAVVGSLGYAAILRRRNRR
jgi:hypothetical protein